MLWNGSDIFQNGTDMRKALHGIKMPYSLQKDAYADLEFLNDVGGSAVTGAFDPRIFQVM